MQRLLLSLIFSFTLTFCVHADTDEAWALSTLESMTIDEKIGQLFIAGVYANKADAYSEGMHLPPIEYIESVIHDYHIGGVIFKFDWDPLQQIHLVNHFQNLSKRPLFIAQDLEWGLTMRLSRTLRFPKNMTLGAIVDDTLIYEMGREVGRQARLVGVNFNFSPVVDINSNPDNPIINDRSFGDDKDNIARKGMMMMKGLQDAGVIACAKHFPGHGDTSLDSHHAFPVVSLSRERLQEVEFYPFREMIKEGVMSVMCGHLSVPALESMENMPASLSPNVVTKVLKGELGFKGLVVTDDLLMRAVSHQFTPGDAALQAFHAGNDLILSSRNIAEGFTKIKVAVEAGEISVQELDERVLKILKAKTWTGVTSALQADTNIWPQLITPEGSNLKKRLYRSAITFLGNEDLLPARSFACVQIGGSKESIFFHKLNTKVACPLVYLTQACTFAEKQIALEELSTITQVVVGIFEMKQCLKDRCGISEGTMDFIKALHDCGKEVILVLFGSPYAVRFFPPTQTILVAYEEDPDVQAGVADIILGKSPALGELPIKHTKNL